MATGSDRNKGANFGYMLAGLMLVLLAGPVLSEFGDASSSLLTSLIFTVTMFIGIWTLVESRLQFWIGVVLALGGLSGAVFQYAADNPSLEMISLASAFAFCVMSAVYATRGMFLPGRINANRLAGAICVYLLIGIAFAVLNIMAAYLVPGSFNGLPAEPSKIPGSDMIYYSFVTMSTLGYGDITPARPIARGLAYMASIAGQFYIAMLVSALVSMYLSTQDADC